MKYTPEVKQQYEKLFKSCRITKKAATVVELVSKIRQNRSKYSAISQKTGVPWYFIGLIQALEETSFAFKGHLHNGDPLNVLDKKTKQMKFARTVRVPKGRPLAPPKDGKLYTWEESALDALALKGLINQQDWSIPMMLFRLESFNGYGYRQYGVNSPYLWSCSQHYTKGKYIRDHVFDKDAVSQQVGSAVLLHELLIQEGKMHSTTFKYDPKNKSDEILALQRFLNQFLTVKLLEDGVAGPKTSEAVFDAFGAFLEGDPRE